MRFLNHIILNFYRNSLLINYNYWFRDVISNYPTRPNFISRRCVKNKYRLSIFFFYELYEPKFSISATNLSYSKLVNSSTVPNLIYIMNSQLSKLNIHVLRKERLYTKLKYSRSPAYDIVSGGIAVLFAGLLGFLVSEKFGMELVDSGDFYYIWMYFVFISFLLRPIIASTSAKRGLWHAISPHQLIWYFTLLYGLLTQES